MGASQNMNRSKSVSAWIDHLTQEGTTIGSPLVTAWVCSPSRNRSLPSKTW
jgi:hypothetical protein